MRNIDSMGGMPRSETGTMHFHAELGLPDKVRAINVYF